jgi:tetratricopeptide (TPR) repeat protein
VLGALSLSLSALGATAISRDRLDEADYNLLVYQHPDAAKLFIQGEAATATGNLAESAELFQQALGIERNNALLLRRYCEVLTQQRKTNLAIETCHQALSVGANPAGLRATVAALLQSGRRPNTDELAEAMIYIDALRRNARSQVYSYAAECDLAATLGNWPAFSQAVEELERLFPNHPETQRKSALLRQRMSPRYVSMGWVLIGVMAVVVAAGSWFVKLRAKHSQQRSRPLPGLASALLLLFALGTYGGIAHAEAELKLPEQLSNIRVDDNNPEATIPSEREKNREPLQFGYYIMDLSDRAELALNAKNYPVAVRYFRALAKAVPDRAVGFSKLCEVYQLMNDREHALNSCRAAALLEGVKVDDYLRLTDLVLAQPGSISAPELTELSEIAEHLRKQSPDTIAADRIDCKVGVRFHDVAKMSRCTAHMAQVAPIDLETISFQWAFAMMRGDYPAATAYIDQAQAAKMPEAQLRQMQKATTQANSIWHDLLGNRWLRLSAVLVALLGLGVWLLSRSRSRLSLPQATQS